jgi:hypothetical protein
MEVFPECEFMWFGDSGQADIMVGEQLFLLNDDPTSASTARTVAVYIQDVVKDDGVTFKTSPVDRARYQGTDIVIAENYLQVRLPLPSLCTRSLFAFILSHTHTHNSLSLSLHPQVAISLYRKGYLSVQGLYETAIEGAKQMRAIMPAFGNKKRFALHNASPPVSFVRAMEMERQLVIIDRILAEEHVTPISACKAQGTCSDGDCRDCLFKRILTSTTDEMTQVDIDHLLARFASGTLNPESASRQASSSESPHPRLGDEEGEGEGEGDAHEDNPFAAVPIEKVLADVQSPDSGDEYHTASSSEGSLHATTSTGASVSPPLHRQAEGGAAQSMTYV